MRITMILAMVLALLFVADAQAFGHRRGKRCHGTTKPAAAASCSTCSNTAAPVTPVQPAASAAPVVVQAGGCANGVCTLTR
jgi:hypothetical protein